MDEKSFALNSSVADVLFASMIEALGAAEFLRHQVNETVSEQAASQVREIMDNEG